LLKRLSDAAIESFYRNDLAYASTYVDREQAEFRLRAIDDKLLDYVLECFSQRFHRQPRAILDVGSGGGHFVAACRRRGIECFGTELSISGRGFAADFWGIELDGRSFSEAAADYTGKQIDVVTFWGLLEHIPEPNCYLRHANELMGTTESMVFARVPNWDSLSTIVQASRTSSIVRHLDPFGHIMIYTQASLAELFTRNGFVPTHSWMYGMDAYEFCFQLAAALEQDAILRSTGALQTAIQAGIDSLGLSDLLVLAGVSATL
jgi:2-polyprenyl-3-methyl-5-hydroxy-6-metoxy-1,4-benzoquinol methylase